MTLPDKVNIAGKTYRVVYCEKPSDVDVKGRYSYWGMCDYWACEIRIYRGADTPIDRVWETLWHEMLHAIAGDFHLNDTLDRRDGDGALYKSVHDELDVLAATLADTLVRNGWVTMSADVAPVGVAP